MGNKQIGQFSWVCSSEQVHQQFWLKYNNVKRNLHSRLPRCQRCCDGQGTGKREEPGCCFLNVRVYLLFQYILNLLDHFTLSQLQATFSLLFHRVVISGIDMSPIMFGKIVHFVRIVQIISLFITNCSKKGKLLLNFFRCMCFTCFVMLYNAYESIYFFYTVVLEKILDFGDKLFFIS